MGGSGKFFPIQLRPVGGQTNTSTLSVSSSVSSSLVETTVNHTLQSGEAEDLKFFSRQTNTIYSPKLELRWDDHLPATGSNTGSLTALDLSGQTENYLYQLHKENRTKKLKPLSLDLVLVKDTLIKVLQHRYRP